MLGANPLRKPNDLGTSEIMLAGNLGHLGEGPVEHVWPVGSANSASGTSNDKQAILDFPHGRFFDKHGNISGRGNRGQGSSQDRLLSVFVGDSAAALNPPKLTHVNPLISLGNAR